VGIEGADACGYFLAQVQLLAIAALLIGRDWSLKMAKMFNN
jgi:hypothetical protein